MKICACVQGNTNAKALYQIGKANKIADLIELRLDAIKDPDLKKLLGKCRKPAIVTARSMNEGGITPLSKSRRIQLIEQGLELNADFVDIELSLGAAEINKLKRKNKRSKIILSFHNTKNTPSMQSLKNSAGKMNSFNPQIIKIVTKATSYEDNNKLIKLLEQSKNKHKMVCFAMGKKGSISRVISPLIGNDLIFAAIEKGKETAKGQFTVEELKSISKVIP